MCIYYLLKEIMLEAFFDWLICKILSFNWSIECSEAFVASTRSQPKTFPYFCARAQF